MQSNLFGEMQSDDFFRAIRRGEKLHCPCCHRNAQIYRRNLHFTVAMQLIRLHVLSRPKFDYINAAELIYQGQHGTGDFSKAKYWGLIEHRPVEKDEKSSGFWRLTNKGCRFVENKITIPHYALVFDDNVLGFEGGQIDIKTALATKFDYEKLMTPEPIDIEA